MTFWVSALVVLILDQITKYWVMNVLTLGESRPFIGHFLNLTYVHNPGAAFSILAGNAWISIICAAVVVAGLVIYNIKYRPVALIQFCLGIIVGGATGNFIDRWIYHFVRDFLDLGWWPVFNVADIGIVCGGTILVIYLLFLDKGVKSHG